MGGSNNEQAVLGGNTTTGVFIPIFNNITDVDLYKSTSNGYRYTVTSVAITGSINACIFLARAIYLALFFPERLIIVDSPVCTAKMDVTAEAFEQSKDACE